MGSLLFNLIVKIYMYNHENKLQFLFFVNNINLNIHEIDFPTTSTVLIYVIIILFMNILLNLHWNNSRYLNRPLLEILGLRFVAVYN